MLFKKKINFIIYFSIFSSSLNAQVFFTEKKITDENPAFTLQDKNRDYITCGRYTEQAEDATGDNYRGIIYKISKTGFLLQKKTFNNAPNFFTCAIDLNNNYLFVGSKKYDDGFWYVNIIKTDYDLNIIEDKKIGEPSNYSNYISKIYNHNDTLILAGNIVVFNPNYNQNAIIYKLSLDLDSLSSKKIVSLLTSEYSDLFSIIPSKKNSGFKISSSVRFDSSIFDPETGIVINNLDNNFNILNSTKHTRFIPLNFTNHISPQCADLNWLNDSVYIVGIQGRFDRAPISNKPLEDVATIYMNKNNDNQIYYNLLGLKDTSDLANYINNSVLNDSIVYCVGTNRMTNPLMIGKETTWLMVNKQKYTSSGIVTEWEYFYGGDARYRHTHVLATKDGGCLITARRYDTSGVYLSDVFFLKIQEDGTPYPVGGINKTKKSITITISPNPASDIITATFPEKTYKEIGLINMQGETIFKTDLQSNLSQFKINVNSFASGTYSVYFKEKETGFGIAKKIIIQH